MKFLGFFTDFLSDCFCSQSDYGNHILDSGMTHLPFDELTDHQRSLCNAIDTCGVNLDNSERCLQRVMKAINADPSDAAFVKERIALNIETSNFIDFVDSQLREAEKLIKKF